MTNGMHEVAVMSSILEAVREELKKHHILKVEEVLLAVGEMTFLGVDQLNFAFEVLTKGTDLDGSTLVIEKEEVEVSCLSCGYRGRAAYHEDEMYHSQIPTLNCPTCGKRVQIIKGKSCMVRSIKVVEDDVQA
jgi:hydrogenase nickel incorporation protein HypA/HybF